MNEISPPTKRESTDDRRAAIAMAARALIIEKGFEGLRTRDIADRVGINIATLHYHVPSRQALIELVAQTIKAQFKEQGKRRPRINLSPLVRLRMEFEDFRENLIEHPDLAIIFSEMMDKARRDVNVEDVVAPLHTFWTGQFEHILAAGITDGSFRPDLHQRAGALLISGALSDYWRRSPKDIPTYDRLALELERAVINPAFSNKEAQK
jgi:AcrR family transcriptional regulator